MKLADNIRKLIKGTSEGKIKWEKRNPTTFNWKTNTSEGTPINTILQIYKSKDNQELSFRLWDLEDRYNILAVEYSKSDEETKLLLKELYETVSGSNLFIDDIFSDILRDI